MFSLGIVVIVVVVVVVVCCLCYNCCCCCWCCCGTCLYHQMCVIETLLIFYLPFCLHTFAGEFITRSTLRQVWRTGGRRLATSAPSDLTSAATGRAAGFPWRPNIPTWNYHLNSCYNGYAIYSIIFTFFSNGVYYIKEQWPLVQWAIC